MSSILTEGEHIELHKKPGQTISQFFSVRKELKNNDPNWDFVPNLRDELARYRFVPAAILRYAMEQMIPICTHRAWMGS